MNKRNSGKAIKTILLVLAAFVTAVLIWIVAKYQAEPHPALASLPLSIIRG